MNLYTIFFFARRLLFSQTKEASLRSILYTAYTTIALTTCACALIISIMQGFHDATKQALQSVYPDIIIDGNGRYINLEKIKTTIEKNNIHIQGISPHSTQEIMLFNQREEIHHIGFIQAINPHTEVCVTPLHTMMIEPRKQFSNVDESVILGKELAQSLHVYTGDTITLLLPDHKNISRKSLKFSSHEITVSGIIQTGIYEFDSAIALTSFSVFTSLFPEQGVQKIYIKAQPNQQTKTLQDLKSLFPKAWIYSWEELYPQIIQTFGAEEIGLYLIIILLSLLACSTIIAVLSMYLTLKKIDCALFMAFGATKTDLSFIFLTVTSIISSLAASIGLLAAYMTGILLKSYYIIPLPEHTYYTQTLPIVLQPSTFAIIYFITIIISLLISIIPLYSLKKQAITQILKSEI